MSSNSIERVQAVADREGFVLDIVEYPYGTRTAADAAAAVGCEVAQIVKSMIFAASDGLVLALTSGENMVNPDRLATAIGSDRCGRADADEVRRTTGFAIGGVAPFGHLNPIPAVMDPRLLDFDTVWAAAGTPRHVFGIAPTLLRELANATTADFTT